MDSLSHTEITARLGRAPETLTFFGQCYEVEADTKLRCALTGEVPKVCFTIKPKDGSKGRIIVSEASIPYFERFNADLYVKLKSGLLFLELRRPAIVADIMAANLRARINAAMAKYDAVRKEAKSTVRGYQKTSRGKLPEHLAALRALFTTTGHYFKEEENRAVAIEQRIIELEKALNKARAVVIPAPQPEVDNSPLFADEEETVAILTKVPAEITFLDIPELDF
jgi:hypothetical protein